MQYQAKVWSISYQQLGSDYGDMHIEQPTKRGSATISVYFFRMRSISIMSVVKSILALTSGLDWSSRTIETRYLNYFNVSIGWPLTVIDVLMASSLFLTRFLFSALMSMPYLSSYAYAYFKKTEKHGSCHQPVDFEFKFEADTLVNFIYDYFYLYIKFIFH